MPPSKKKTVTRKRKTPEPMQSDLQFFEPVHNYQTKKLIQDNAKKIAWRIAVTFYVILVVYGNVWIGTMLKDEAFYYFFPHWGIGVSNMTFLIWALMIYALAKIILGGFDEIK